MLDGVGNENKNQTTVKCVPKSNNLHVYRISENPFKT